MEGVEASAENGSQLNNPDNFYVDLNNPELIQTVKELKEELHTVKLDNERILEMNQMLLDNMNNIGKEKRNVYETDFETTSYKHKGKKEKYSDSEFSSYFNAQSRKGRYKYMSDSSESDHKPRRRKYKPYEEISGEFKKTKPPMFNGEVEKGEEEEAWMSGMKKYFHIYNYCDRLKAIMAIYNLTRKDDIWWQDIKWSKILRRST